MYVGGTNFGFMNGANYDPGNYQPTVTSYDYDAPINESGDPTDKFFAIKKVFPITPIPRNPFQSLPLKTPKTLLQIFYRDLPASSKRDYTYLLTRLSYLLPRLLHLS